MCGIAGFATGRSAASAEVLGSMVEAMVHRGPDGEHHWVQAGVALGMRRLAIIDVAGGIQPLTNEHRTVFAVFNGEIYNHQDLRARLSTLGHSFNSMTDGEVIPHLYEEVGVDFAAELNGIFAIALWDARRQRLVLARDQFGVKPLYACATPHEAIFASEIKALLKHPRVPRRLNLQALDEHLTFRFTPAPRTLLDGVQKVRPGCRLVWEDGQVTSRAYGTESPSVRTDISFADAADELLVRLRRAVHGQMMSDRPIGLMLSGGIDSAAVLALMAEQTDQVKTFTVGFAGGGDSDETDLARQTARLFGAEHHELIVGEQDFSQELREVITMLEEPVGTTSALGFRSVAKLAKEHVPVLLSGQGADELLAGYWRYVGEWIAGHVVALPSAVPRASVSLSRMLPPASSARIERGVRALRHADALTRFMNIYAVFTEEQKTELYRGDLRDARAAGGWVPDAAVSRLRDEAHRLDRLNQMMYIDTRLWLPDDLLLVGDKMTMAESVEMRVPFLDPHLVCFVESLPSSYKLRFGRRKAVEKRAARQLLPRAIIHRKERGFMTPVDRWLREGMYGFAREALLSDDSKMRDVLDQRALNALLERHAAGTFDHTRQIFSLLSLELWSRKFLGHG